MFLDILQYLGTGLGVGYATIISLRPKLVVLGLRIGVVSCIILGSWGFITGNYGIAASQTAYTILNAIGIYKWKRQRFTDKEDRHGKIS